MKGFTKVSGKRAKLERKHRDKTPDHLSIDREMIRDDVDWLHSTAQSVRGTPWEGPLGIALAPQMARVVHEGFDYVTKRRPAVGKPLERRFHSEIATARHTIKLVDDNQRSLEGVMDAFRNIGLEHSEYFANGPDLALTFWKDKPLFTSHSAEYQTLAALKSTDPYRTSVVIGQSMKVLLEQGLGVTVPTWTPLQFPSPDELVELDENGASYYPTLYSSFLSEPEKDLLLTAESTLNSMVLCEVAAGEAFMAPVFRSRLLAFIHAVSAVKAIAKVHSHRKLVLPETINKALDDDNVVWVTNQRALRNRAMHYGIPRTLVGVSNSLPMYGIVEATCDESFVTTKGRLDEASARLSDALGDWRNQYG